MKYRLSQFLVAGVVLGIAGCSTYEPHPMPYDLKSTQVIGSTSSLTQTIVHDGEKHAPTCTMPAPDATFADADQMGFGLSLSFGGTDSSGESGSARESEMSGRTPAVLMARELFFRLCEFGYNQKLEASDAQALFRATLSAVQAVWQVEASNTKVTIGNTLTTSDTTQASSTESDNLADTLSKIDTGAATVPAKTNDTSTVAPTDTGAAN